MLTDFCLRLSCRFDVVGSRSPTDASQRTSVASPCPVIPAVGMLAILAADTTRDAGDSGAGGVPPPPPLGAEGAWSPNFLHEGNRGTGDGLPCKAFRNGCYIVNRNFAVKS